MPFGRIGKRQQEEEDRSPVRHAKRMGRSKKERTYDTYDEAMDGKQKIFIPKMIVNLSSEVTLSLEA